MKIQLSDLWRWDGTIDRGPYALIGLLGFAIKHNIDRFVATLVFHRKWSLFNYWIPPTTAIRITALSHQDAMLLGTLLILALPFIWMGVALTLRRLRAIRLPTWLVIFFFLPVINLVFFLLLSVLPTPQIGDRREPQSGRGLSNGLDRLIPDNALGSAAMAVLLTLLFDVGATALCVWGLGTYGWSLFVALPFCHGLVAVLLYGYHRPRSYVSCLGVSVLSILVVGAALIGFAIEGAICLAMAWPIATILACMGGSVGYLIQRRPWSHGEAPAMLMVLILFVPVLMGAEYVDPPETPRFEIHTAIEINAPPEEVWRHLISFPDLQAPTDWLFRLGVAYPIHATVNGQGAGAVRECLFSTGTFTEPVSVWDQPHHLEFSVASGPPTMHELSPYQNLHTRHLEGYLRPERGEFILVPLPNGHTRLEGTSWYQNAMWPGAYWELWSNLIVHRIHLRVFKHIKQLAEANR